MSTWSGNPVLNQSFGWPTPRELIEGRRCGVRSCQTGPLRAVQETYGVRPERNGNGFTGAQRIFRDPELEGLGDLGAQPGDTSALAQYRFVSDQARAFASAGDFAAAENAYGEAAQLAQGGYVASQAAGELDYTRAIMDDAERGGGPSLDDYRAQAGLNAAGIANQPSRWDRFTGNLPSTPIFPLIPGSPTTNTAADTTAAVMRKTGLLEQPPQSGREQVAQDKVDKAARDLKKGALDLFFAWLKDNWWLPAAGIGVAIVWKKI